jgi:hypothetical protein
VTNGSVNQFLIMQDNAANRQSRWALIEINELAGYPGEHLIHRCGTVTWSGFAPSLTDACTLRTSLSGQALAPGKSFALDASNRWQFCYGGATGSNEVLVPHGQRRRVVTLISAPPWQSSAEAGVGRCRTATARAFPTPMRMAGLSSPAQRAPAMADELGRW